MLQPVGLDWDPHLHLLAVATKAGAVKVYGQPGDNTNPSPTTKPKKPLFYII